MKRLQLALRVADLEASITFYSKLLGVGPAKLRAGYANFVVIDPPMKLVLIEGDQVESQKTSLDHLGIEVGSTEEVKRAAERLAYLNLETEIEDDSVCCYARQDKVWVHGPGEEAWEVYVVKDDVPTATNCG